LTGVLSTAPDPGLGSVAFGLGSDQRNTITDFTDAQGLYATGEPLQAAAAAAEDDLYDPFTDSLDQPVTAEDDLYDPFIDSLDQPDVEEVFETPGFQGQAEESDAPVDFGTPEQRQQQLQRFAMALDLARQLDSDLGRSGDLSLVTTIESNTPSQQERQEMPANALAGMNNEIATKLGEFVEQPQIRPLISGSTQFEIRKSFPGLLEPVGVRAGTQADVSEDDDVTRKRERDPTVRDAGPPKFEMRTISASDVGEQRQNRKILADREFRRQEAKRRRERERARRPRKTQWGVNAVDPYAEAVEAAQRAFESADQPFGLGTSERQQLQDKRNKCFFCSPVRPSKPTHHVSCVNGTHGLPFIY
jgi:hypothetical protein